ncbi:hypothetical protein PIB30_041655 [Stylosanthes scabra]|uniref:Uncharacterized protein n=1 Tax=Stylosanthes scabra TaxID=79078 RepID=A0ABU6QEE6_9FABA|nr:hypothetical protein [Stylosanthes scabra]
MAQRLFKINPEPDEDKRLDIAQELGMSPNQVKFWFQDRRNQKKSKEDNEMMEKETDDEFKEKLKDLMKMCQASEEGSRGPSNSAAADGDNSFEQLMNDNQPLKYESDDDELSCLIRYIEDHPLSKPISLQSFLNPTTSIERRDSTLNHSSSYHSSSWSKGETSMPPAERNRMMESERALMVEVAKATMEEVVVLVSTNEPLWESINSPNSASRLVLIPEIYDTLSHRFPIRVYDNNHHHFNNNSTTMRVESSRDSRIVKLQASELVDAILNHTCWTNMFPTMIPKAITLQVLKKGTGEGNQHGALQLEEMHLLSPLLPTREFFLLRFCQQLESNAWFIADVSYNHAKEEKPADQFRAWKRPSGCKIEALPDGTSRVTWVENVLVDDLFQTHPLFRDLLLKSGSTAYGAEKWLMEIQRTSERFASFTSDHNSNYEIEGVMISLSGERRNLMRVCQRMVREFCGILKYSSKKEYNQNPSERVRDNGIRFSICDEIDEEEEAHHHTSSNDSNAVLAASIWLPFTSQHLFSFFSDPKTRSQWDFICSRNRVEEVARFSTGTHPDNYISLMRLVKAVANKAMIIIQESFTSSCGSYIIYSPITEEDLYTAIHGDREASISVPILLYGLTISDDEDHNDDDGGDNNGVIGSSLLALTLQVPIRKGQDDGGGGEFIMEPSEASAAEIIVKIIEKIKVALDCPESDAEDDSGGNDD